MFSSFGYVCIAVIKDRHQWLGCRFRGSLFIKYGYVISQGYNICIISLDSL